MSVIDPPVSAISRDIDGALYEPATSFRRRRPKAVRAVAIACSRCDYVADSAERATVHAVRQHGIVTRVAA